MILYFLIPPLSNSVTDVVERELVSIISIIALNTISNNYIMLFQISPLSNQVEDLDNVSMANNCYNN